MKRREEEGGDGHMASSSCQRWLLLFSATLFVECSLPKRESLPFWGRGPPQYTQRRERETSEKEKGSAREEEERGSFWPGIFGPHKEEKGRRFVSLSFFSFFLSSLSFFLLFLSLFSFFLFSLTGFGEKWKEKCGERKRGVIISTKVRLRWGGEIVGLSCWEFLLMLLPFQVRFLLGVGSFFFSSSFSLPSYSFVLNKDSPGFLSPSFSHFLSHGFFFLCLETHKMYSSKLEGIWFESEKKEKEIMREMERRKEEK